MVYQALDDRKSARALFVDYSKAFDHATVLSKMTELNIHPCLIRWMHSFLSNRRQRVEIGPVYSQWTSLTGGMPQGTWLGPYVFLVLIDDLHTILDTFKFVDDATMVEIIDQTAARSQM
jgi:hypothetical protein